MTAQVINGHTGIVAPIGFPTDAFMAPMIYNGISGSHHHTGPTARGRDACGLRCARNLL